MTMTMMLIGVGAVVLLLIIVFVLYTGPSPNDDAAKAAEMARAAELAKASELSKAPPMMAPRQDTVGNNGSVDCQTYCQRNWNSELPVDWNGAKCVASSQPGGDCNVSAMSVNGGVIAGTTCTCEATGTGWVSAENFRFNLW